MSEQIINITVPKGAKVIVHEEAEPEPPREATLGDILKAIEELKAIEAARPTWYPWYIYPYVPLSAQAITVTSTNGTTSGGWQQNIGVTSVYALNDVNQ